VNKLKKESMMKFAQKSETTTIQTGGRSGTPVLEMPNITQGNTILVTVTFITKMATATSGVTYKIQPTKPSDAIALSTTTSIVEGNTGWQATVHRAFFQAKINSPTGVEEIDFEVLFEDGDYDGQGEMAEFLITGQVVTLSEP
jgi:hypothetical protein